jgi:N-acetylglucosamine kinase-like BadF-type ATPase
MLTQTIGLTSAEELLHHLTARSASDLRHWGPRVGEVLLAAAADGDALATSVVRDYAGQIADYIGVAAGKVRLGAEPFPVVMTGGLLQGRGSHLAPFISSAVELRVPHARPHIAASPPVAGAVLEAIALLNGTTSGTARTRVMNALPVNSGSPALARNTSGTESNAVIGLR